MLSLTVSVAGMARPEMHNTGRCYEAGTAVNSVCYKNTSTSGDTVWTSIIGNEFIRVPNVFTPDGDGVNDYFSITSSGLSQYKIEIYDRWGLKVFESESILLDWDGRSTSGIMMSEGTYFYVLKAISLNGADFSRNGPLYLFRSK